ncbi:hypothetical protein GGI17_000717 [Coemansia sp. S146]|nr:hypothetical protein GGI17_000717 [Coemansia sp. S146]
MKLSTHILVCALAATTAVAAPASAPKSRGLEYLINPAGTNGVALDRMSIIVTNMDDAIGLKSNGEQAFSALIAGKLDNYYSYVGNAASIIDKYLADSEVASFASEIIPLLKVPSKDPELNKVNESLLARLEDPAVQQNFASVMKVVNDYASYYADYAKSEFGIDMFSAMVAKLPSDALKHDDNDAPHTPTATSGTTPKPSSDSKTNSAGPIGVASLSKIALGVAVGALAAQLLEAGYRLPGQQAQDEKIVSSLLVALSSQNIPTLATAIAGSIAPVLGLIGIPTKLDDYVSSVVSELRNPAFNSQIADIVEHLIELSIKWRAQAPEVYDPRPSGPTSTSTSTETSARTKTHPMLENTINLRSPKPSSTSARSSATSPTNQSSSSYESSSFSTESLSSSKSSAAQSMRPMFEYLSMGVAAGVVASFF